MRSSAQTVPPRKNARSMTTHRALFALLLILAAGPVGCRSVDWDSRVGNYTYDDAVRDYGPPDNSEALGNGSRVSSWTTSVGRNWIDKLILTFDENGVLVRKLQKRF